MSVEMKNASEKEDSPAPKSSNVDILAVEFEMKRRACRVSMGATAQV